MIKNTDNKAVTKGLSRLDKADAYLLSYYDDTLAMMKAGNLRVEELYRDAPKAERDYRLTVCVLYGFYTILLTDKRHKPGYRYCPDQRPYTFRLLGKPAQGLSPPFPVFTTSPIKTLVQTNNQISNLKKQ